LGYILGPLLVVLFLSATLGYVERRYGARPPRLRARGTDLAYWLAQAWVFNPASKWMVIAALLPFSVIVSVLRGRPLAMLAAGHGPVLALSGWARALLALLVVDFVGYWMHRAMHRAPLWRAHAIHHSSQHLDWLSAARNHPVAEVLPRVAQGWVVIAIGFPLDTLAWAAPLIAVYALVLHAELPWTFGPLRYVIASPVFHRWHHSSEPAARDKNFAGLFAVIDLLFGTYHMPNGQLPTKFGVDEPMPSGLWAQMKWPFARDARRSS
jgi:sterol desaturase/sphingolipid hydroxylase (fatty acid hydroxylase superfamily)